MNYFKVIVAAFILRRFHDYASHYGDFSLDPRRVYPYGAPLFVRALNGLPDALRLVR